MKSDYVITRTGKNSTSRLLEFRDAEGKVYRKVRLNPRGSHVWLLTKDEADRIAEEPETLVQLAVRPPAPAPVVEETKVEERQARAREAGFPPKARKG